MISSCGLSSLSSDALPLLHSLSVLLDVGVGGNTVLLCSLVILNLRSNSNEVFDGWILCDDEILLLLALVSLSPMYSHFHD